MMRLATALLTLLTLLPAAGRAGPPEETPSLAAAVAAGTLPAVAERLPRQPLIVEAPAGARQGGSLRTLIGSAKDVRLMVVYGYARLVVFNDKLQLVPDILEKLEVTEDRIFTFHLRPGHRWSDGAPFTAEDFRYFWEDVALNRDLSPTGVPVELLVDGKPPRFEVIDATTVRFSWDKPNPNLLPRIAGASPLYLYRPAHYLKRFHASYTDPEQLKAKAREAGARNWAQLHNRLDNQYRNDNPDLPTLDPWVLQTKAPAQRFMFKRNPFYHRQDTAGRQLPYLDEVAMTVADPKIVAVKTGAGESDLQARYLSFDNYTFLRQAAERNDYNVRLWTTAKGSHLALFPNLTVADPVWRGLMRDVRVRRALSLGIDRHEINQVVFYGLATEGNNTMLRSSPLYSDGNRTKWATYDPGRANALLDEAGLNRWSDDGFRLLPDGRPMMIVVESPGDTAEQTDVLQLIRDTWAKLGVKLLIKSMQQEVFRNRVFAGETVMSISAGAENGVATPDISPAEWAPTNQQYLQWSQWGNFYETMGKAGSAIDMPEARQILDLYRKWESSPDSAGRKAAWEDLLALSADQVFSIGLIGTVPQPIVVSNKLRGVPDKAMFNWDPGANFGMYRMDGFWFGDDRQAALNSPSAPK